ncbi:MAG: hypothetical protein IKA50_03085 [Clostridia bacterium]|nr:hypothetical protein [Clostridia bacterium]
MDKFDPRTRAIVERLQQARMSLLEKQPFYALLLLHMRFALDLTCETAYTDGTRIAFHPDFIDALSDSELQFVLMHEVLHAALGHPFRHQAQYDIECFDKACDIVVNSNILYSWGMDLRRITLNQFGEAMHLTPDGEEGYLYSIEQVYGKLMAVKAKQLQMPPPPPSQGGGGDGADGGNGGDGKGDDGKQQKDEDGNADGNSKGGKGQGGKGQDSNGSGSGDNSNGKGGKNSKGGKNGKGGKGGGDGDITDEDLQDLVNDLLKGRAVHGKIDPHADLKKAEQESTGKMGEVDDHTFWKGDDENNIGRETWLNRMVQATDIIAQSQANGAKGRGITPVAAERIIEELKNPKLDWRTILNDFVQEEICDYSFSPPDRRMQNSPFFLPDFNEKDESVKNLLFMIDTSQSMSNDQITECYSEIYGAIQQFGGKLQGKLGFFDAVVVEPTPFESEDEFKIIRPKGGGGTSFDIIFDYVQEQMADEPPVSIIILTDGYAPIPDASRAMDIPVLWIINNDDVTPEWGKIARILSKDAP